jgi:flavin reductase (DIM6/NTAB) family NADH-FMN oxidoreductase RutF
MMLAAELDTLRHQAARRFVTGVAVLTVWHGETAHGTTVSSVTTLSKVPLLIGASLRSGSAFTEVVSTAGRFALNVLSGRQVALAGWFARPERPHGLAQFDHLDWEPDAFSGAPWIDGSLASVGCRVTAVIPVGDHDLILAEVITARANHGAPLLHFAGRLHEGMLRALSRDETHPFSGQAAARRPAPVSSPVNSRMNSPVNSPVNSRMNTEREDSSWD